MGRREGKMKGLRSPHDKNLTSFLYGHFKVIPFVNSPIDTN